MLPIHVELMSYCFILIEYDMIFRIGGRENFFHCQKCGMQCFCSYSNILVVKYKFLNSSAYFWKHPIDIKILPNIGCWGWHFRFIFVCRVIIDHIFSVTVFKNMHVRWLISWYLLFLGAFSRGDVGIPIMKLLCVT